MNKIHFRIKQDAYFLFYVFIEADIILGIAPQETVNYVFKMPSGNMIKSFHKSKFTMKNIRKIIYE